MGSEGEVRGERSGMCRGAVVRGKGRGLRVDWYCTCPAATRGYASHGKQPLPAGCRHGLVPGICTLMWPRGVDRKPVVTVEVDLGYVCCVTYLEGSPLSSSCVCVCRSIAGHTQDAMVSHKSKNQGQGIQPRCLTRAKNNNDNNNSNWAFLV